MGVCFYPGLPSRIDPAPVSGRNNARFLAHSRLVVFLIVRRTASSLGIICARLRVVGVMPADLLAVDITPGQPLGFSLSSWVR